LLSAVKGVESVLFVLPVCIIFSHQSLSDFALFNGELMFGIDSDDISTYDAIRKIISLRLETNW